MINQGRTVEFQSAGREARGFLAEPAEEGKHPALIVIQEWWGLNEHIKDITMRFASEGYVALAPDLYDGKATKDPQEAGRLMQSLDQDRAIETLNGAVAFLQSQANVDAERIGVTGFCMGGTYALLLACRNKSVKASAPFYGDVASDEDLKNLSAPVLFIGASEDEWITTEKMDRLKEGLARHGKEGEVKVYPGVGHAFFNDTRPEAYDKAAAEDAWQRVTAFLAAHLKA